MVSFIFVVGLYACTLHSAEASSGPLAIIHARTAALREKAHTIKSARPSGVAPHGAHKHGFLEVPPKSPKEAVKPSPVVKASSKTAVKESPAASPAVAVSTKPAGNSHVNSSAAADNLLHPKVEYDPDTAALMAQADAAIKEADAINNAPPKPVPHKENKDENQNLGMIKALRGMVCGHKLKKHLQLCDLKEFTGAEVKSEVSPVALPEPAEDSAPTPDTDSVASRADDLMAKVDSLQNAVATSLPEDGKSALLDVIHDAKQMSRKHTTGAEAMALMKTDVTAGLPASVRDTILSVMNDAKSTTKAPSTALMNTDVTAGLPASVRDTVLAVMKDAKH